MKSQNMIFFFFYWVQLISMINKVRSDTLKNFVVVWFGSWTKIITSHWPFDMIFTKLLRVVASQKTYGYWCTNTKTNKWFIYFQCVTWFFSTHSITPSTIGLGAWINWWITQMNRLSYYKFLDEVRGLMAVVLTLNIF